MIFNTFCVIFWLFGSVQCKDFTEFSRIQKFKRVDNSFITSNYENVSRVKCAFLCLKDINCSAFQFTFSTTSNQGSCEFLNTVNADMFSFALTNDNQCSIYKESSHFNATSVTTVLPDAIRTTEQLTNQPTFSTTEQLKIQPTNPSTNTIETVIATNPSTTTKQLTTQSAVPSTTTERLTSEPSTTETTTTPFVDRCNYAPGGIELECTCSTSDHCSGILKCTGTQTANSKQLTYLLDRTKPVNYSMALSLCKQNNKMELIRIRNEEDQATVCNMLNSAVGDASEYYWMGLTKLADGTNWQFKNGLKPKYNGWESGVDLTDEKECSVISPSKNFTWSTFYCPYNQASTGAYFYALCMKLV